MKNLLHISKIFITSGFVLANITLSAMDNPCQNNNIADNADNLLQSQWLDTQSGQWYPKATSVHLFAPDSQSATASSVSTTVPASTTSTTSAQGGVDNHNGYTQNNNLADNVDNLTSGQRSSEESAAFVFSPIPQSVTPSKKSFWQKVAGWLSSSKSTASSSTTSTTSTQKTDNLDVEDFERLDSADVQDDKTNQQPLLSSSSISDSSEYADFRKDLPSKYLKFFKEEYATQVRFSDNQDKKNFMRWFTIANVEMAPGKCTVFTGGGDIYIEGGILKNPVVRNQYNRCQPFLLTDYVNAGSDDYKKEVANQLVKLYKIHLMPREEINGEVERIFIKLLTHVKSDEILQQSISQIKIKFINTLTNGAPRIVIYVYGKDKAQAALNRICGVFGNDQGSNILPAYNQRASSLIFFSQGDRDHKKVYPEFFEGEDKVYYKPFIQGDDYHLKVPSISSSSSSTDMK